MFYVGTVDTRMDQSAFFQPGSPPDQAQHFLDDYFGGSQFLQVHVKGDLGDPHVLRELQRLADRVRGVEKVSQVLVIADPIAAVNDAMQGAARIPDTSAQVGALYGFLAGNAGARQLVTADKSEGLIHVKIGSNKAQALDHVVEAVTGLVNDEIITSYRVVSAADALIGFENGCLVWCRTASSVWVGFMGSSFRRRSSLNRCRSCKRPKVTPPMLRIGSRDFFNRKSALWR